MRFQNVYEKLQSYSKTEFSGAVKIGIEMGKCVSFGVSNDFDVPKNEIDSRFVPEAFLLSLIGNDFFGTIIYFYKNGIITHYSYCQSFKGESLNKFLGER